MSAPKAGRLTIATRLLAPLIGLHAGHRIVGAEITPTGAVEFLIEGHDMPPLVNGEAQHVTLTMRRQPRVTAFWAHAPEDTWTVED